jgi:HPt (histidine-containing phosphotransfer) domain-containing protein
MSKKVWIILLVVIGVGLAIVLGALGNSQSSAEKQYCSALDGLQSSVEVVAASDPSTNPDQLQSDIAGVQQAWGNVKSASSHLSSVNQSSLDKAWSGFQSAVKSSSGSSSSQSIVSAAQSMESAVQSSIDSRDCSSSSS